MADIFEKKTWSDRIAEYITRRTLTKEDGSTEIVTVERNEGEISQEGDAFDAATMNDLEDRINNGFEKVELKIAEVEQMSGIPLLDFEHPLHRFKSSATTYTCTEECYLTGTLGRQTAGNASGKVQLVINNEVFAIQYGSGATGYCQFIPPLKLNVGDVVELTGTTSYIDEALAIYVER